MVSVAQKKKKTKPTAILMLVEEKGREGTLINPSSARADHARVDTGSIRVFQEKLENNK